MKQLTDIKEIEGKTVSQASINEDDDERPKLTMTFTDGTTITAEAKRCDEIVEMDIIQIKD